MSVQDKIDSDLRRFMLDDMPDNVNELCAELERQTTNDVAEVQVSRVVERQLFSEAVNRELAKHRPSDIQKGSCIMGKSGEKRCI